MVASLPVLVNRTASAEGTMLRKRSAASTSADVAAAKCEPSAMASDNDRNQLGMSVAVDESAEGHHKIHVLVVVGVPDMRTAAPFQEDGPCGIGGLAT